MGSVSSDSGSMRVGKRLELLVRRTFIRLLGRPSARPRSDGTSIALPERPRILLVRHDRIGDVIISTPTLALLRKHLPSARIEILLGRKNRAAASLIPNVDETILIPGSLGGLVRGIRLLRRRRYDLVINLLAKDSASGGFLSAVSAARARIGFDGELGALYDVAVPRPAKPEHVVRETSQLLEPLGIPPIGPSPVTDIERLAVIIPEEMRRHAAQIAPARGGPGSPLRLIINISTPSASRRWPAEKLVELAHGLDSDQASTAIASTPEDADLASEIASKAGVDLLPPCQDFVLFAALLDTADIIMTPDTSIVHLAAALGKPVIVLNTAADAAAAWTPWGVPYRLVCGRGEVSEISVADVRSALCSLLDEIAASHKPSTRL